MQIGLNFNNRRVKIDAKKCNSVQKAVGLMFSRRQKARILFFEFQKNTTEAIHSFFVFYKFIAIWFDDAGEIIEKRVIRPFTLAARPKKPFKKLIEIPINNKYKSIVKLLVGD